jgi:hypothetical protein
MARFQVGRWVFPSKKALVEKLQRCLHRVPPGSFVEGEEGEILALLLESHPHAQEKIGCGIRGVVVGRDSFGGFNYQVVRTDGSQEPFSYRKTISAYNPEAERRQRIKRALRQEVADQTQEIKREAVGTKCPESGLLLEWDKTDVDHAGRGFAGLVQDFLAEQALDLLDIQIEENDAGDMFYLVDRGFAELWQRWHRRKASLRALHRDSHRTKEGATIRPLDQTYLKGSAKLATPVLEDQDEDLSWVFELDI